MCVGGGMVGNRETASQMVYDEIVVGICSSVIESKMPKCLTSTNKLNEKRALYDYGTVIKVRSFARSDVCECLCVCAWAAMRLCRG